MLIERRNESEREIREHPVLLIDREWGREGSEKLEESIIDLDADDSGLDFSRLNESPGFSKCLLLLSTDAKKTGGEK